MEQILSFVERNFDNQINAPRNFRKPDFPKLLKQFESPYITSMISIHKNINN